MLFTGICKSFELTNEQQYETIGQFWDEMAALYGLENLQGLGFDWHGNTLSYAIGLKDGQIPELNMQISLPEEGWITAHGETSRLKEMYDEIYKGGPLKYEIETFDENGHCQIRYIRSK